jgi:hypothetical protein
MTYHPSTLVRVRDAHRVFRRVLLQHPFYHRRVPGMLRVVPPASHLSSRPLAKGAMPWSLEHSRTVYLVQP